MEQARTYYIDEDFNAVDEVGPNGIGKWSGKSAEKLANGRKLTVMTAEQHLHGETEHYKQGPERITKEQFWHALDCLPPDNWVRLSSEESFRVPEAHRGLLNWHYVRIGEDYYELLQPRGTKHHALIAIVQAALPLADKQADEHGESVDECVEA